jgi:hypothetical protein
MLDQDSEYNNSYNNSYNKTELVEKIKHLLAKVESTPRIEKYQYVVQIYDCLAKNKKFVTDHEKFYLTLKTNANSLIKDMVKRLSEGSLESSEIVVSCQALLSIVNCIKLIDGDN